MKIAEVSGPGGPELKVGTSSRPPSMSAQGSGPWLNFRELSTEAQGLPWLHWPLPLNQRTKQDRLGALRSGLLLKPRTFEVDASTTRKLVKEALSRAPPIELRALANAVLEALRARGFAVSREVETHIRTTNEISTLRGWLRRAATVARLEELFSQ